MASRGHPKLTQATHDLIIEGVRLGMPKKFAAQRASVSERALFGWLADARKGANGLKASLFAGLKGAEGDFIAANLKIIERASKKSWPAAAWLLERLYNEYFSANRAENMALRKQVAELLKQLGQRGTANG